MEPWALPCYLNPTTKAPHQRFRWYGAFVVEPPP